MSEESKGLSETPDQSSSAQGQEVSHSVGDAKDSVKYDTYKRTLGEAKKFKNMLEETQERLQVIEQEKLQAEGKTQELLQSVTSERDDLKSKLAQAHGAFAGGRAMDAIVDEASKMGVASTGLLRKAIGERVRDLEFDDEYRPNVDQVRMLLEEVRKEEPLLFAKDAPKIANHKINASTQSQTGSKPLKDMSNDELMTIWQSARK